jgi:hypothetical protein
MMKENKEINALTPTDLPRLKRGHSFYHWQGCHGCFMVDPLSWNHLKYGALALHVAPPGQGAWARSNLTLVHPIAICSQ